MAADYSLADIKAQARQDLHERAAVPATYLDDTLDAAVPTAEQTAAGLALTVRWHHKLARAGSLEGGFDGEVLEGVDRLIFAQPELDALGLTLRHGGVVTIEGYGMSFELDHKWPGDGPHSVYWTVLKE